MECAIHNYLCAILSYVYKRSIQNYLKLQKIKAMQKEAGYCIKTNNNIQNKQNDSDVFPIWP